MFQAPEKTFDLASVIAVPGSEASAEQISGGDEGAWKGWTGDLTIAYAPVEEMNTYVKFSHGLKAGHFNAGLTTNPGRCPKDQALGDNPSFLQETYTGRRKLAQTERTTVTLETLNSQELVQGLKEDKVSPVQASPW